MKKLEVTNNKKNYVTKEFGIVDPNGTQKLCHNKGRVMRT